MKDILSGQIKAMNMHLAKSRADLGGLLKEDEPKIIKRDGTEHEFNKDELLRLAGLLPEGLHSRLKLPIYIELSSGNYGSGTGRVTGELECRVVRAMLDKSGEGDELFVYLPEIRMLRKELPTTTDYMFTLALGD